MFRSQDEVTDPEEPVEEGDVVRPLLECRLKEGQGALDTGSVLAVCLVVGRGVFYRLSSADGTRCCQSLDHEPDPSWFLHCLGRGDSLPELSGEADRRPEPGSSDMVATAGDVEGERGVVGGHEATCGWPSIPSLLGSCWQLNMASHTRVSQWPDRGVGERVGGRFGCLLVTPCSQVGGLDFGQHGHPPGTQHRSTGRGTSRKLEDPWRPRASDRLAFGCLLGAARWSFRPVF